MEPADTQRGQFRSGGEPVTVLVSPRTHTRTTRRVSPVHVLMIARETVVGFVGQRPLFCAPSLARFHRRRLVPVGVTESNICHGLPAFASLRVVSFLTRTEPNADTC